MKKIFLLPVLLLLLIGAGCGTPATTKPTTVPTSTQKEVIKKPVEADLQSHYYDFCEQQGDEAIIRFDTKTERAKVYCRFKDTTECEAEAFIKGTCTPGNGSVAKINEIKKEEPTTCPQNYDPVCGEDNLTYSNSCFAVIKKIKIKIPGVCPPIKEIVSEETTAPIKNSQPAASPINKDKPDWLAMATNLLESESPQTPRAFIDKCMSGTTIFYYEFGGISSFATLYDNDGRVICYPSNDFNNSCPDYSTPLNRKGNCTRLWTDAR